MKELTVISGKGGTGKTTITAALVSLASNATLADADCDASNLQLILTPKIMEKKEYFGSSTAVKIKECSMCGRCREVCRFNAIDEKIRISEVKCEGCGACEFVCPEDTIEMREEKTGTVFKSRTRFGPMVHSELEIGEEASGKMVTQVKQAARELAEENDLLIIDGSPGIGCPVIASIKGSDHVLVVTEPTVSGVHDLKRVLSVTDHFGIDTSVCINKSDINPGKVEEIKEFCNETGTPILGEVPYDESATEAMINEETVIEYSESNMSNEIKSLWKKLEKRMDKNDK
ncbi:MAG: 4Fe-4S binding protein [Candidatus Hadarchaeota archaeon]